MSGPRDFVENALVLDFGHFGIVADLENDIAALDLHDDLDVEPCILLELEVVPDIREGIFLECFHADFIVARVVDIEFFLDKIDALRICLFGIGRKFVDAVAKIVLETFLIDFGEKASQDLGDIQLNFMRQRIRRNRKRNTHSGGFLYFRNIDRSLAFFLHTC